MFKLLFPEASSVHYVVAAEPEPDALVTHKGYDPTLFRWSFKNEDEMGPAWGEGEEESGLESLTAVSRGSSLHPNLCALSAKRKPYTAEPVLMGRRRRNCQPHVLGRRGSSGWFDGGPISEPPSGCLSLHTPRSSLSLPAPACSVLLLPRHPPPLLLPPSPPLLLLFFPQRMHRGQLSLPSWSPRPLLNAQPCTANVSHSNLLHIFLWICL